MRAETISSELCVLSSKTVSPVCHALFVLVFCPEKGFVNKQKTNKHHDDKHPINTHVMNIIQVRSVEAIGK